MDTVAVDRDKQISLNKVVGFLAVTWKKLVIASLSGFVFGAIGWFFVVPYTSQYILLNNINFNTASSTNTYALDLVSWKTIQKSLPNLAAQVLAEGSIPEGLNDLYVEMSEDRWWQKNIIPSYAISRADTKDLAGISKDLDAASTTILSLTVYSGGVTKQDALKNVRGAARFLRTGGAYLQLRNILNSYEGEAISSVADIQKKITTTEIEIGYLLQRAKALEDLNKRFPGGASVGQQVVDPKESGAKFLPISTQIVAVNNDINLSKENLQRFRDRLVQITLMKTFLDEATPLAEKTFDGLLLSEELLSIESRLRAQLTKEDSRRIELLDQLHAQLLQVQARFTKGLEANTAPTIKKFGLLKTSFGALFAAFILTLLALLSQKALVGMKRNSLG